VSASSVSGQKAAPVAVVDLGSNSIRLVVYDGLHRAPLPVFNERALVGLGRELEQTGRLDPAAVAQTLSYLDRFMRIAADLGVCDLSILATAAVRDAEDGKNFAAEVERRTGYRPRTLSGGEEARYSALGVVSSVPDADGLVGDLGGGSLELVALAKGRVVRRRTLPLGPLRLIAADAAKPGRARKLIGRHLNGIEWLDEFEGRPFYPVGGAWRTLARTHMIQSEYPLHVIHEYTLTMKQAQSFAALLAGLGRETLAKIPRVPARRADALPLAAHLMERLLARMQPEAVVFSANGLREGYLYSRLSRAQRAQDPLLVMTAELARDRNRTGDQGKTLMCWTDSLFPGDPANLRRLRLAACQLSDLAWRLHPDYRAIDAYERILHWPFVGVDHPGRAILALAVYCRYGGDVDDADVRAAVSLLSPRLLTYARTLGRALRLAYTLTGAAPNLLRRTGVALVDGVVQLTLLPRDEALVVEQVERRRVSLDRAHKAYREATAT
jgi:exopolyphosphatase/guanosine-5'-triphosphate,3'-diphosphate pyrophosphatase